MTPADHENRRKVLRRVAAYTLAASTVLVAAAVAIHMLFAGRLPMSLPTFPATVVWTVTLTASVLTSRRPREALAVWLIYVPAAIVAAFQVGGLTEAWLRGVWP